MIEVDPLIQRCVLMSFALLYAVSAWHKARNRLVFAAVLENYRVLPNGLVGIATNALILTESVTALLLLSPAYAAGIVIGITLQIAYFMGITINLARGRLHIDCGCLGTKGDGISYFHAARNLGLLILLMLAAFPTYPRDFHWLEVFMTLFFVIAGIVAYATINKLLINHTRQGAWR